MRARTIGMLMLAMFWMPGLQGCDDGDPGPCVCTEEFRTIGFFAVDAARRPVEGIALTVTLVRTGEVLPDGHGMDGGGYYVVATDAHKDKLLGGGEPLLVTGVRDTLLFEETFIVGVPGDCRCHIQKIAGPDTLFLSL